MAINNDQSAWTYKNKKKQAGPEDEFTNHDVCSLLSPTRINLDGSFGLSKALDQHHVMSERVREYLDLKDG